MEAAVLRGLSLKTVRPWIILVEATVARTQIPNYQEWDPLLTNRGYRFVHFDGLNRFYVAEEKAELDPAPSRSRRTSSTTGSGRTTGSPANRLRP